MICPDLVRCRLLFVVIRRRGGFLILKKDKVSKKTHSKIFITKKNIPSSGPGPSFTLLRNLFVLPVHPPPLWRYSCADDDGL